MTDTDYYDLLLGYKGNTFGESPGIVYAPYIPLTVISSDTIDGYAKKLREEELRIEREKYKETATADLDLDPDLGFGDLLDVL